MRVMGMAFAGILVFQCLAGAETAQAAKIDNVRDKPFTDGKIITALKKGQTVDIQKREGSWYFVKVGTRTGWVPMMSIHRTTPASAAARGSLSTVATGRSSTGGVVSTTGVRGINEENLKKAVFSDSAVVTAEKYRVPTDSAAAFARQAGLQAHAVPPLSAPASTGGKK